MSGQHAVAIIGAGDMGRHHIEAWQSLGHKVVSITDVDRARTAELAGRYGIGTVFTDYTDAVADGNVDIVSICLPLPFHPAVTIAAAQQGKHVLCEKPLARTLADAAAMEQAVRSAGVQFAVGFQRNYADGVWLLRDRAAAGFFGRPMIFSSDLLQPVRPKVAMHDRNGNNGPLTDGGCHYYMLWQSVFRSRPKTVYAQGRILAMDRPELIMHDQLATDSAVVTVEYESGDIATMTLSWGLPDKFGMRGRPDRILGPKGGAEGNVQTELTFYADGQSETVAVERRNLHAAEFEQFVSAIEGGGRPKYGFAEGRQMIILTRAIEESIATGKPVRVDYDQ